MQTTNLDQLPSWTQECTEGIVDFVDYNQRRQTMLKIIVDRINRLDCVELSADETGCYHNAAWRYLPRSENATAGDLMNKLLLPQNEFGHARVETMCNPLAPFDIGGHCVVPPRTFEMAISSGWAVPHPFAGRYHAVGKYVVPETLIQFRSPRSEVEVDQLWEHVFLPAYNWLENEVEITSRLHELSEATTGLQAGQ